MTIRLSRNHIATQRALMKRCAGITLIELMVAMVLSLVLMAGVLTIFTSTKTSYRLQTGLGALQENGRYALQLLIRDIRSAGFGGCAGINAMTVNVIANNMPDGISSFTGQDVLDGKNNVAAGAGTPTYDAVVGTDVLQVRGVEEGLIARVGADMSAVNSDISVADASGYFEVGDILMITDCGAMDIFRATGVTTGTTVTIAHGADKNADSGNFYQTYGTDALVLKFRSNTYFIKDTGRDNEVGDDILALYRRDANDVDTELVEGIEDMQINYGIDSDGNGIADRFVDATVVENEGLWANVLAVEVALLASSVENAHTERVSYTYVGLTSTPVDPTDLKLRQELASTVTIRNRVN